ncbi:hypothetical protein C4561_01780 [candidate division WWE3 bacterium]|uniref:Uncharacterized protein n=1 Tax=candidate division WWE3 bacterium TaxID=2053526 RepID=A0A3A4ZEQ8_UNCKA|nr:MAG: hypothetical protein C4561_01780 [candidate division WWE3 bacterium]
MDIEELRKQQSESSRALIAVEARLARGKDNVEIVSEKEVYLLDNDGVRYRRICGTALTTMPEGFYCLRPSGSGTNHLGVGRCSFHDRSKLLSSERKLLTVSDMLLKTGYGKELRKRFKTCETAESLFSSVDSELELLYRILRERLSKPAADLNEIRSMINQIIKVKMVRQDLLRASLFTRDELLKYFKLIVDTCKDILDETQFQRLMIVLNTVIGTKIESSQIDTVSDEELEQV